MKKIFIACLILSSCAVQKPQSTLNGCLSIDWISFIGIKNTRYTLSTTIKKFFFSGGHDTHYKPGYSSPLKKKTF